MALLVTGQNLPPPQSPFVDPKTGVLSNDGYQFLLDIISNALQMQVTASVASGLAATGTNQATALLLSSDWNEIDDSTTGTGVLLASLQPGQQQLVFNNSAGPIDVFPPPGMQIDTMSLNSPYVLSPGIRVSFDFFSDTQIRS